MSYLFTSESVSCGHPDKICDQISDALLDEFLSQDPNSRVACETLATTGLVVCSGEVTTEGYVSVDEVVRKTIKEIGYVKSDYQFDYKSCGVISTIHSQSPDIAMGVNKEDEKSQGAGDQGLMFGYACNETPDFMPLPWWLANKIMLFLNKHRNEGETFISSSLRPDAKSQVTVRYSDNGKPICIDTIVVSTQHDELYNNDEDVVNAIRKELVENVFPDMVKTFPKELRDLFNNSDFKLYVNPTGKFVIGGPHGDTGLTGRKIIVDTYGGVCPHGGGAFSGKDPSKVDRSAAYAARYLAKNLVAAGICDKACIQLSYAIGIAKPVGIYVNTYGTAKSGITDEKIANYLLENYELTPYWIINKLKLKNPIYKPTAAYGHFGRTPYIKDVKIGNEVKAVEFFTWEKLDEVEKIKKDLLFMAKVEANVKMFNGDKTPCKKIEHLIQMGGKGIARKATQFPIAIADNDFAVCITNFESKLDGIKKNDTYPISDFYKKLDNVCRKEKSAGYKFDMVDDVNGEYSVHIYSQVDEFGEYYTDNTIYFNVIVCNLSKDDFKNNMRSYNDLRSDLEFY